MAAVRWRCPLLLRGSRGPSWARPTRYATMYRKTAFFVLLMTLVCSALGKYPGTNLSYHPIRSMMLIDAFKRLPSWGPEAPFLTIGAPPPHHSHAYLFGFFE